MDWSSIAVTTRMMSDYITELIKSPMGPGMLIFIMLIFIAVSVVIGVDCFLFELIHSKLKEKIEYRTRAILKGAGVTLLTTLGIMFIIWLYILIIIGASAVENSKAPYTIYNEWRQDNPLFKEVK